MDLNLPAYETLLIDELTYRFTTNSGDTYKAYLLSYASYFFKYPDIASNVFGFNIERINTVSQSRGIDKRIAATIVKIVGEFLVSETDAVVYVCDPTDGLGEARMRKFTGWFEFYTHESNKIYQLTTHVNAGGILLYNALLLNKHNPLKARFAEAFMELNESAGK